MMGNSQTNLYFINGGVYEKVELRYDFLEKEGLLDNMF